MAEKARSKMPKDRVAKIDALWKIMDKSTPAEVEKIIAAMPSDLLRDMRVLRNMYRLPVADDGQNRYLHCSIINLPEKYQKRIAMTSLISFAYRMLDEYDPRSGEQFPSENDANFSKVFNAKQQEFARQKPIIHYQNIMDLANAGTLAAGCSGELQAVADLALRRQLAYRRKLILDDQNTTKETADKAAILITDNQKLLLAAEHNAEVTTKLLDKYVEFYNAADRGAWRSADIRETFGKDYDLIMAINAGTKTMGDLKPEMQHRVERKLELILPLNADHQPKLAYQQNKTTALADMVQRNVDINSATETHDAAIARGKLLTRELRALDKQLTAMKTPEALAATAGATVPKPTAVNDDDLNIITEETKAELGVEYLREEHTADIREYVTDFLNSLFKYNPDDHVRCAYAPNYKDPERQPIPHSEVEKIRALAEQKYERVLIPPADTFARWQRYEDSHYEEIRQATEDIYGIKSDVEFAVVPLEVSCANSEKEALEHGGEYKRMHRDEFDATVHTMKFNQWSLMAAWEKNRERTEFYNKDTEVLRHILEQHTADEKMGKHMMKQRGERMKKKDLATNGPDAPGYRAATAALRGDQLTRHGAKHIDEIDDDIIPEDIPQDHGASGSKEIEVGVHKVHPILGKGRNRGRVRGITTSTKFHLPAEAPEEDAELGVMPATNEARQSMEQPRAAAAAGPGSGKPPTKKVGGVRKKK